MVADEVRQAVQGPQIAVATVTALDLVLRARLPVVQVADAERELQDTGRWGLTSTHFRTWGRSQSP